MLNKITEIVWSLAKGMMIGFAIVVVFLVGVAVGQRTITNQVKKDLGKLGGVVSYQLEEKYSNDDFIDVIADGLLSILE